MRTFSVLSVVVALAIGAYVFVERSGLREVDGSSRLEAAESRASSGVAAANLQSAAISLQAAHAAAGTYEGAQLSVAGVRLVRAGAGSYCLETGSGAAIVHLRGPQGTAAPGPCR
jgi:hypothetical protein